MGDLDTQPMGSVLEQEMLDMVHIVHAATDGEIVGVRTLLQRGTTVNARGDGETGIQRACNNLHLAVAELLIAHGADLNVGNEAGMTLLHFACVIGSLDMAGSLIKNSADVHARDFLGWTPLHKATGKSRLEVAQLLLNNGADVNAKENSGGWTPLHVASLEKQPEGAKFLVANGAKINEITMAGRWHCITHAKRAIWRRCEVEPKV